MLFTVSGRVSVLNDASSCMSLWDVFYHILWMWEKTVENATILNTLAGGFLRLMSLWWFANYKSCAPAICLCHKTFWVPTHINVVIVKVSSGTVIRRDKETICVEIKDRFVQSFLLKYMYVMCWEVRSVLLCTVYETNWTGYKFLWGFSRLGWPRNYI